MTRIKIVLPAPPKERGLLTPAGTRMFVGDGEQMHEVENIEALYFATSIKPDALVRTTLVLNLAGAVEVEVAEPFADDEMRGD